MAYLKIKNRVVSALAADITSTATSLSVIAGEGAKFPATGDFHITIEDEILKCTARSTDTLTVVRAQEGTTAAGHIAGKSVELRITAGVLESRTTWTADKLLKGADVGVDPTEIDVPAETGNTILEKLQKHLGVWWFNNNWLPAGMIDTALSGSGSFDWCTYSVSGNSGTTSASYARLYKYALGLSNASSWDKKRFFGVFVRFYTYSAQNIHIISGFGPNTGAANTYQHIGFKLIDDTLYGTVADGTTESTLSIETLTAAGFRRLECILTPGTECRFYVDGVDKGAITTNLPTGTTYATYMLYSTVYNTEAVNKCFAIYESRIFQEE